MYAFVWAGSTLTEVLGYKVVNFAQIFVQSKHSSATKPLYKSDHTRSPRLVKPKLSGVGVCAVRDGSSTISYTTSLADSFYYGGPLGSNADSDDIGTKHQKPP